MDGLFENQCGGQNLLLASPWWHWRCSLECAALEATWTKMKSPQKCWVLEWGRRGQAETVGDGRQVSGNEAVLAAPIRDALA